VRRAAWKKAARAHLERNRYTRRLVRLRDRARYARRLVTRRAGWEGVREPFSGQRERIRVVRTLIGLFEPDAFVETGTFIGSTTRFFCGNGLPVYTAEIKPEFWLLARLRLGWATDATVFRGDSRAMLRQLAAQPVFRRPFAYLDAHWGESWSLSDEIALLCAHWPEALIVIDDFLVEGDDGYGHEARLTLERVPIPGGALAAFPATPSQSETGARRGTLYVGHGPDATGALRELIRRAMLREAESTATH
jgi:hypothetical protein